MPVVVVARGDRVVMVVVVGVEGSRRGGEETRSNTASLYNTS